MSSEKIIDGVPHVWSIHDNAWITLDDWENVNSTRQVLPTSGPGNPNTVGNSPKGQSEKIIDGVVHVWSIHDNAWVSLDYWEHVNGR